MAQIIGLPKLSPTMEEGVLVKWVKHEGDAVSPGDLVAEVETDKANMDFTLEDEGTLLKLLVAEGDTIKLGAPVAILGEPGEEIAALVAEAMATLASGGAAQTTSAAPASPAPVATSAPAPAPAPAAATPAPTPQPAAPAPTATAGGSSRLLASPLAKNLAIELGIDIRTIAGSGPGGRIVERDVRAAAGGAAPTAAAAPVAAAAPPSAAAPPTAIAVRETPSSALEPLGAIGEFHDSPLSNMRKRIAERLTTAKRDTPHFYLTREFDPAPMMAFRARLNDLLGDRGKVSLNDLIIKGAALALQRVPACNAAFTGDAIRYFHRVHIGVAVAIEDGLVTPVVRDADLKGIGGIAAEVRDLAGRAKTRGLKAHEITGSTFTISNLGMFGIDHFDAIINPPEGAILAVGGIRDVPVVADGQVVPGKRMTFTLSCDHRVIDGALGAQLLAALVDLLEHPEALAL